MRKFYTLFLCVSMFVVHAQGPTDDGLKLNGIDEYVLIPDSKNINDVEVVDRTIETWFKVSNTANKQIIYKEGGGKSNGIIMYVESGNVIAGSYAKHGKKKYSVFFKSLINADTWTHIALVFKDGSTILWYVNGVEQGSKETKFPNKHNGNIYIGTNDGNLIYPNCSTWNSDGGSSYCIDTMSGQSSSANFLDGNIWGFRVWDTARTEIEINAYMDLIVEYNDPTPNLLLYLDPDFDSVTYKDSDEVFQNVSAKLTSLSVVDNNYLSKEVSMYINNQVLYTRSNLSKRIEGVTLYSLNGAKVLSSDYSDQLHISNLNSGIYIAVLELEDGIRFSKKVLKR